MTAFEDAARTEAERRHPAPGSESGIQLGYTQTQIRGVARTAHISGWKEARDHLAAQEPTDAEVRAVMKVCREFYSTPVAVGPQFARAVLSASREAVAAAALAEGGDHR